MNCEAVSTFLVNKLQVFLLKTGLKGFTVGVSGGIDSALVSTLCALTDLPTLCVTLPIHQAPDQVARGEEHIKWLKKSHLNVQAVNVDLTDAFDMLVLSLPGNVQNNDLALVNIRARLRMTTLYSFGNIVVGTGNKIEDFGVGFFTKYGDGGVDVSPTGDLLKTEVHEVSSFLQIVNSILTAKHMDGLWADNRSDEDQIGASYPELEWALDYSKSNQNNDLLNDRQRKVLDIYLTRHAANQHKMKMPEIFCIPENLKS